MAKASEIEKKFAGYDRGKVQGLEFYFSKETKEWTMKFKREDGNEDRDFMEKLFVEFGGRNPETCKSEGRFLTLDGSWKAKDLKDLGHTITKVQIRGVKVHEQRRHPNADRV
jgi:hypothetical protein